MKYLRLSLLFAGALPSFAGFVQFAQPDSSYLSSTNYLDFSSTSNGTTLSSLADGTLTISLSPSMTKVSLGNGWGSWSSSPDSQFVSGTLFPILEGYDTGSPTSLTFTFSSPLTAFGLETEPNPLANHNLTLAFYNGATLVGTITRTVSGSAGARLFAASADQITSAVLSSDVDFAVAGIRYSQGAAPEPGTVALFATGLAALAAVRRRRRTMYHPAISLPEGR